MRQRSVEGESAVLPRNSYFPAPTPIIAELRESRARYQEQIASVAGNVVVSASGAASGNSLGSTNAAASHLNRTGMVG